MAFERKLRCGSGDIPELGAIFMCNRATKKMCFSWETFGLPYSKSSFVKQVKAGMFLFLFEHETRMLYGVYQACTDGTVNFTSNAFSSAGRKYPAQVKFRVIWYCEPLSEDEFRPAIEDNYFAPYKFNFGLSKSQVWELLTLFSSRKLGDALQQLDILPNPIIDDAGERFGAGVLKSANSPNQNGDLEKFSMPNRKVHGRLLIEDDRDHGNADADTVLPNKVNCGVPYMPNDEGYDPDAPLLNDMTAIRHLQRCREEWDERVHTENAVDGRPHFKVMCDSRLGPLSQYCNSTPNIDNEIALNVIRQPSATCYFENAIDKGPMFRDSNISINGELLNIKPLSEKILLPSDIGTKLDGDPILPTSSHSCDAADTHKRSVFSRLKPALDAADDEGNLEDPQKSIDDMVNEVMETLKGHYCQLVSESKLAMDQVSDDDDNNSKFKKSPSVNLSTEYEALTGRQINGESPRLSFKRRSEVHKTSSAAGDMSSAEKQCKRRKLVRPSSDEKKLSSKDGVVDKVFSCQSVQDGSINTHDKEQNPLEAGNLGSLVLATGVENEFRNGIADIGMGSAVLDVSLGGKSSSRQSASNREDNEGAELSLAFVADDQKDGHTMLENASFGLPPKGVLDHVKETSSSTVDEESIDCTLKFNFTMFSGDKKPENTVCSDMYGEVKSDDIGDLGVSTEMELGRAQYLYVAEVPDNGSGNLVELHGVQEELMGHDKVHGEAISTNLLTEAIPASCQSTDVPYFEFLTK